MSIHVHNMKKESDSRIESAHITVTESEYV
jgi:hypothetical protein